jgi:sirohydrochlorin cobaltochelatase
MIQTTIHFTLATLLLGLLPAIGVGQNASGPPSGGDKKVSLILVGHGGVAKDFPKTREYFRLHAQGGEEFRKIEDELIHWPRNGKNDEYWAGFMKVADELRKANAFHSVHVAFNEMCAPTVEEALEETLKDGPDTIVLTSIMMTPGGVHSERDIPASIEAFKKKNPNIALVYAWPYDVADISSFLISHINKFTTQK